MKLEKHTFRPMDLVGGEPVLDFVNTVTGRDVAGRDWLPDFGAVISWMRLGDAYPPVTIDAFEALAKRDPDAAAEALGRLKELREALFALLYRPRRDLAPDREPIAILEATWREARQASRLEFSAEGRLSIAIDVLKGGLDWLRYDMAVRTVDLLADADPGRLKVCAGENCAWVFADRSKAGRRRWCDMKTCGNAAKTRRHSKLRRTTYGN